jgi:hypothetical protein
MIPCRIAACLFLFLFSLSATAAEPKQLFNGKDLAGWEGNPKIWSADQGAIVGRTTAEAPIEKNTFLIWRDGELGDFRLTLQYRIVGGNSGIQYRAKVHDPKKWIVSGYQADIDSGATYSGILYEELGRGILALRGQRVTIADDGAKQAETFADAAALQKLIRTEKWNDYVIEARGERLRHYINDTLMSETVDAERGKRADKGILALQVHAGPPMTVQFRNLELQTLDADSPDYEPKQR